MKIPTYTSYIRQAVASRRPNHPVWTYDNKLDGLQMAADLGWRIPHTLFVTEDLTTVHPPGGPFVLKPHIGCAARGVFPLVSDHEDGLLDLFTGQRQSWSDIAAACANLEKTNKHVRGPWLAEEAIFRPGSRTELSYDWKLFCFGAKAEVIRQIDRKSAKDIDVKWYTRDWVEVGEIMRRHGRYNSSLPLPKHPDEIIAMAESLAAKIASPFIRMDLFEDDRGAVFGEVTVHPDGGQTSFEPTWDRKLGLRWAEAEKRM